MSFFLSSCHRVLQISEYAAEHGHTNIPNKYSTEKHYNLGRFVNLTRNEKRKHEKGEKSSLTEERIKTLEAIGFNWGGTKAQEKGYDDAWDANLADLKDFKEEHGHCLVPSAYKRKKLARWVAMQRIRYDRWLKGELTVAARAGRRDNVKVWEDRFKKLKELDFCFDVLEAEWEERFEDLSMFKDVYGHVNVGFGAEVDPGDAGKLARWTQTQRAQYKAHQQGEQSSMTEDRIERLEALGFVWALKKASSDTPSSTAKPKARSIKASKNTTSSSTQAGDRPRTRSTKTPNASSKPKKTTIGTKSGSNNKFKAKKIQLRRDHTGKPILDRTRSKKSLRESTNKNVK